MSLLVLMKKLNTNKRIKKNKVPTRSAKRACTKCEAFCKYSRSLFVLGAVNMESGRRLVCLQRPGDFAPYRLRLFYAWRRPSSAPVSTGASPRYARNAFRSFRRVCVRVTSRYFGALAVLPSQDIPGLSSLADHIVLLYASVIN